MKKSFVVAAAVFGAPAVFGYIVLAKTRSELTIFLSRPAQMIPGGFRFRVLNPIRDPTPKDTSHLLAPSSCVPSCTAALSDMVLDKTRPGRLRFFHTSWEVSSLCAEATELIDLAVISIAQHHLAGDLPAALHDYYVLACIALAEHIQLQAGLPRVGNMENPIPVRPARPDDFGPERFTEKALLLQEGILLRVALGAGVRRSLGQVPGIPAPQPHAHPRGLGTACPSAAPVLSGAHS
eukprot:2246857-Rhodomonas_salina.1